MDKNTFPYTIIFKYYPDANQLRHILLTHSEQVARKALQVAETHPELQLDKKFLEEAALLHDIGIFLCDAPSICCVGTHPYICHGYLGAQLMREEGYERHAWVCERHTGAGLSLKQIESRDLPVPHHDMLPVTLEEQVVCFADKFFSKTRLEVEKTVEQARNSLMKFGEDGVERFDRWCQMFL